MTSPKKEEFLARWAERMAVPVCHGVGGSFDVIAGKVRRAPRFWQAIGMEWLYRALQEPRRLAGRYLVTNVRFVWMVLCEMIRPRRTPPAAAGRA
jgi:N-acetylglucosaminyldiphosphoundecaprenol N-acetyl-beta-D-mannosaminyltransferase